MSEKTFDLRYPFLRFLGRGIVPVGAFYFQENSIDSCILKLGHDVFADTCRKPFVCISENIEQFCVNLLKVVLYVEFSVGLSRNSTAEHHVWRAISMFECIRSAGCFPMWCRYPECDDGVESISEIIVVSQVGTAKRTLVLLHPIPVQANPPRSPAS